jgi:hypothetical protein
MHNFFCGKSSTQNMANICLKQTIARKGENSANLVTLNASTALASGNIPTV